MDKELIRNALVSISDADPSGQAVDLFPNLINILHQQGLISTMSPHEYEQKSRQIFLMQEYKERANASADRANELSERISNLEAKLNSRFHRWLSSSVKLSGESEELSGLRSEHADAKLDYTQAKSNYDELKQIRSDLRGYVSAGYIYVSLTGAGSMTLQRLDKELRRASPAQLPPKTRDTGVEIVDTRAPPEERRRMRSEENPLGYVVDGLAGAVAGDVLDDGKINASGGALLGGGLGLAARASGNKMAQRTVEGAGLGGLIAGPPGALVGGLMGAVLGADDDEDEGLF
ncbi:MAG: hypothetical protein HY438_01450 [DPANN group archaeon]|nr:hypothetical protein [DPANN group archaeon]